MNAFELKMHRVNTTAFIGHKPSSLILVPIEKEDTPAGGYKVVDLPPRVAQTFRIIELGQSSTPPVLQLTDGSQREAEFWLLGEHDALVAIGDHWTAMDGRQWEVGDIVRPNHYETRALVAERGK